MKKLIKILSYSLGSVILFAGCAYEQAATNSATSARTETAAKPAPPTKESLSSLENKALEAWKNKDAKYFEGFLTENFVMFTEHGERPDRASVIKMIAENKCEVKSYSISDQHVTPVGADAAVITSKITADYTCEGKAGPSPVTAASVYVRSGDTWKAAYHNEVPIIDPTKTKADDAKAPAPPAKSDSKASVPAGSDALTTTLMALETKGWEAWKNRDRKTLEDTTAKDLSFVDPMGKLHPTKADTINAWSEPCSVKSVALSDGKAVSITKDAAILTYKGVAEGTCRDQPLMPVWATSISVKEGDTWKLVYLFETPA